MTPIITIRTLLQWDNTIFDDVPVPDGADADIIKNTIIEQCGEFETLYASTEAMKYMIMLWFSKNLVAFEHLYKDYTAEYNALYNKDGTIETIRTPDLHTDITGESTGTTLGDRRTFNSADYQKITQDTGKNNAKSTQVETGTEKTIVREFGNIGVTKTTELLKDDYNLWMQYNFYDMIARKFKCAFCVMVY